MKLLVESVFCGIISIFCFTYAILFYIYYGALKKPFYVWSWMILSASLPILLVDCLLPYDIALNNKDNTLVTIMEILYWLSFVLTWFIVPIAVSYLSYSHTISIRHRIWMVIRENLIIFGTLLTVLVGVMIVTKKLSFSTLVPFVISLANGYGLILMTCLLGYGFVKLPMNLWVASDCERNYCEAIYDLYKETMTCAAAVADSNELIDIWQKSSEIIKDKFGMRFHELGRERINNINYLKASLPIPENYYNEDCKNKKILKLRKVKWDKAGSGKLEDLFCVMDSTSELLTQLKNYVRYTSRNAEKSLAICKARLIEKKKNYFSLLYKILSILSAVFIALCYYAEFSLVVMKPEINLWYIVTNSSSISRPVTMLLFTFPVLFFMTFVSGWSLSNVRIGFFFRFIKGATNANTLSYWSIIASRLFPTIGYHYLLQVGAKNTAYSTVLGKMDKVIFLGTYWNNFAPILMFIVSVLVGFNVIGILLGKSNSSSLFASQQDLLVGENVLKELSTSSSNIIELNKNLSVVNFTRSDSKMRINRLGRGSEGNIESLGEPLNV